MAKTLFMLGNGRPCEAVSSGLSYYVSPKWRPFMSPHTTRTSFSLLRHMRRVRGVLRAPPAPSAGRLWLDVCSCRNPLSKGLSSLASPAKETALGLGPTGGNRVLEQELAGPVTSSPPKNRAVKRDSVKRARYMFRGILSLHRPTDYGKNKLNPYPCVNNLMAASSALAILSGLFSGQTLGFGVWERVNKPREGTLGHRQSTFCVCKTLTSPTLGGRIQGCNLQAQVSLALFIIQNHLPVLGEFISLCTFYHV